MSLIERIINVRATRRRWQIALAVTDAAAITLATLLTYLARFEGAVPPEFARFLLPMIFASVIVYGTLAVVFGLYRVVLRYVGIDTLLRIVGAVIMGAALLAIGDICVSAFRAWQRPVPLGVIGIQAALVLLALASIRIAVRTAQHVRSVARHEGERALIVGAGSAGSLLLRELQMRRDIGVDVVGFLDDDSGLAASIVGGVRVVGTTAELEDIVAAEDISELFVALPSANDTAVRTLLNRAADLGLTTHIMPKIVVERGSVRLSDMRKVNVEDLLGRTLTPIDTQAVRTTLEGKIVAVTGAAGSIGAELCRQIIRMSPAELHLFEIDESRLYELHFELDAIKAGIAQMHILDIRDEAKVERVFADIKPQVVLHAAAYKHVPLMETEPAEALRTNVLGTAHIIDAAARHGAEHFVLISTDKAVMPVNVMGKTKELSERLMLERAARYPQMTCVAVRFGNVLGSRGSVVPIFEEKLLRGENLTVTDERATRYFMVIPEAARLVLQAQAIGATGDIFVLEMGEPVRIVDLARKMIALSGIPVEIEFIGLRPGEKLHETLTNEMEVLEPTSAEKIQRVARLALAPLDEATYARITALAENGPTTTPTEVLAL
ncbi:MAG: polysaccharide biosynthesis protein [Coriobacteriia bacterium]|nr:polysaccharide biosynthesis protein [Coriobacteriia bacterium]